MNGTASTRRAPIERVTVPLVPRTTAGCCDLAVMYYGRYITSLSRLYFTLALPAVCLVYGLQRFVGGGLIVAIGVVLLFSKPLGMLTVAALWRTTFGEPFDWQFRWQKRRTTRGERLRGTAESLLTAGAGLALLALIVATIDDEYGAGRLVQLGPGVALGFVLVVALLIALRTAYWHHRDHQPSRRLHQAFIRQMGLRFVLAAPCCLVFFEEIQPAMILLLVFWLPLCVAIIMARSFRTEALALADIDPDLLSREAQKRQQAVDKAGPGLTIFLSGLLLTMIFVAGLDVIIRTLGGSGPIVGPLWDSVSAGFVGFGPTVASILNNPAFGALVVAAGLFVYQLGRIAWFFVFLDSRVRYDCWDMELLLAREAKRLENA